MVKDIVQWIYWYPFRFFIQIIPFASVYRLGKLLGIFSFYLLRGKRVSFQGELRKIFPDYLDDSTSNQIVQHAFTDGWQAELEVLLFSKLNTNNISSLVQYSGLENLDSALVAGRGVMLLFAHFGANQMIMPAVGYRGYKMNQVSAPPMVWVEKLPKKKFSPMGKKALDLRWEQELSLPVKHVNVFSSLKEAFTCLKHNEILGIAIDGGGGQDRIGVDFLGRKAMFSTGAIEIAIRTGCTVLPVFMVREPQGCNNMIVEPPLEIVAKGTKKEMIQKSMNDFVKRLEWYVLQYPYHYLKFLALRQFMTEQGDIPLFTTGEIYEDIINQTSLHQA